jgi:polysaccharide biosynthesis protein PslG
MMLQRIFLGTCLLVMSLANVTLASDFIAGVNTSYRDGSWSITKTAQLGFNGLRDDYPWAQVEKAPGVYSLPGWVASTLSLANENDLSHVTILAYGNPLYGITKPNSHESRLKYARYCQHVVKSLKGRVKYFEVWNEWDAQTGGGAPGGPEEYVELLKVVYPAIKAANSEAVVLSGGISSYSLTNGWLERFLKLGGAKYMDAISLHPYSFQERNGSSPLVSYSMVVQAIKLVDAFSPGGNIPFFITEIGWPTFSGRRGIDESEISEKYALLMLLSASNPRIKGVWWYGLKDQGTDPFEKNHHFGLLGRAGQEKQNLAVVRYINRSVRLRRPSVVCMDGENVAFDIIDPDQPTKTIRVATDGTSLPAKCLPSKYRDLASVAGGLGSPAIGILVGSQQK